MHELGSDAATVNLLESGDDLLQGQGFVGPTDEGCLGQLENRVHVLNKKHLTKEEEVTSAKTSAFVSNSH